MIPSSLFHRCALRWSAAALLAIGASILVSVPATAADVTAAAASNPVFLPITAQQGQVGRAFSYQVAAQNGPLTYAATGLPAGLTIDPASGLVSGVPTAAGAATATVSATNSSGTTQVQLPITIALPPATVTLTADVANAYPAQGIAGDFVLTRTGDISVPLTVNLLVLGSARNGVDYTLTNTTKKFKPGKVTKHIRILAIDESGRGVAKKSVKITVTPASDYVLGSSTQAKVKIFYTP